MKGIVYYYIFCYINNNNRKTLDRIKTTAISNQQSAATNRITTEKNDIFQIPIRPFAAKKIGRRRFDGLYVARRVKRVWSLNEDPSDSSSGKWQLVGGHWTSNISREHQTATTDISVAKLISYIYSTKAVWIDSQYYCVFPWRMPLHHNNSSNNNGDHTASYIWAMTTPLMTIPWTNGVGTFVCRIWNRHL